MSGVGYPYPWQTNPKAFLANILGVAPRVTSTFRTPAQNEAVGGVPNSEHLSGNAIDFTSPSTVADATRIAQSGIPFDQLINEGNHIHVGFNPANERNQTFAINGGTPPPQVMQGQMRGGSANDPELAFVDAALAHHGNPQAQPTGDPEMDFVNAAAAHHGNIAATAVNPPEKSSYWGDVASNLLPSASRFAGNMITPILHPIKTGEALANVALGLGEKLAPFGSSGHERYADAFVDLLKSRYGSGDRFANTFRSDPVGTAADISLPLTLGGTSLARAPGLLGEIGNVAAKTGQLADPVLTAARTAQLATKLPGVGKVSGLIADAVGGLATHTGGLPLRTALQVAGHGTPEQSAAFLGNLDKSLPMDDVVNQAQAALSNLRSQRGDLYRSGMADVSKDATVLNFDPIDKALADVEDIKTYRGQSGVSPPQELSPSTTAVRTEINAKVNEWRNLDPNEFHTPEGFDKLKQQIGDIRDAQPFGSPQRLVADRVYSAIRGTIATQAPTYGSVMADYEHASDALRELQSSLSLGEKSSVDSALRKLQSAMRDNANTTWGRRTALAQMLQDNGAPNLMPALAGQALSSWTPRGLGAAEAGAAAFGAVATGHPWLAAAAPLMSPRLMGNTFFTAGKLGKLLREGKIGVGGSAPNSASQLGRMLQTQGND